MQIHVMCTRMQTEKVKVKKSGTLNSVITCMSRRARYVRATCTPCCRFNIFAHVQKHIAHLNMNVRRVKQGKQRERERGSEVRGRRWFVALMRWRVMKSEEVSAWQKRKWRATGCIKKSFTWCEKSFSEFGNNF